ncbi:pre-60S factor [Phlyctema vagabunda]|uniref:Pre-60S factor n=1 Tax=Phlyctema vagabunda TaxID=108571 RepID=A0ABR4PFX7_9HELO
MSKEHGFSIHAPEQITDVKVYLYWLHLDINEFFSCIYCDAARKSAEGMRHHMVAKGHCKATIEAEAEFYDSEIAAAATSSKFNHLSLKDDTDIEDTVTLPSGRQISNRLVPRPARRNRTSSPSQKETAAITDSATEDEQSSTSKEMRVTVRASDSMALAGLSSAEVRSLRKKEVKMLSAERRIRNEFNRKIEKIANKQKHYRMDSPARPLG